MIEDVFLSGVGGVTTRDKLSKLLSESDASSLFFASAYVTQAGVNQIDEILEENQVETCGAVFGLDGSVTQPQAIDSAQELGWSLRIMLPSERHFHPKIALAGGKPPSPLKNDKICGGYIGSANFTRGGLVDNVEAGLLIQNENIMSGLRELAENIWDLAEPVDHVDLDEYSEKYAEAARTRPSKHQVPGLSDSISGEVDSENGSKPPRKTAYSQKHASAAWAGLETFTGEYTFQVEFPRTAGEVIRDFVGVDEATVDVICDDNITRQMKYKFYQDNGMFRLNIPNEVPGVERARREERGIAIVSRCDKSGVPLELEIINNEQLIKEFVSRSKREGSWDQTSTRLYGWF